MAFMNLPVANQLTDIGGLILFIIVILGIVYKINGGILHHFFHWKIFSKQEKGHSVSSFFTILVRDVFTFRVLGTCNKTKRFAHLSIFWGFILLAVSTTLAFLTNPQNVVLPLFSPVKIFGNAGGVLVIAGFLVMFYVRYREGSPVWRVSRSDAFILTLFLAVVSGFLTQQTIYSSFGAFWVSSSFWIHMVFVVLLLATAPFTKFFHAISKPVSLLYEEIDRRIGAEPGSTLSLIDEKITTDPLKKVKQ